MPPSDLTEVEIQALKIMRNYFAHEGGFPSLRDLQRELEYKSPRSAAMLFEKLEQKGYIKRLSNGSWNFNSKAAIDKNRDEVIRIPVVGDVACGVPLLAQQNIQGYLAISTKMLSRNQSYFFLRARGNSMDKAGINDGDLLLIQSQNIADAGDIVVALINDEATVKKIQILKDCVVLHPMSTDSTHVPMILNDDFRIQGIVKRVVSNFNNESM